MPFKRLLNTFYLDYMLYTYIYTHTFVFCFFLIFLMLTKKTTTKVDGEEGDADGGPTCWRDLAMGPIALGCNMKNIVLLGVGWGG